MYICTLQEMERLSVFSAQNVPANKDTKSHRILFENRLFICAEPCSLTSIQHSEDAHERARTALTCNFVPLSIYG